MAGEYAPMAFGASGAEMTWRTLRCFGHFAVAQAARADADTLRGPADDGAHRL